MAAGLAQLDALENADVYSHINKMGAKLAKGLTGLAAQLGVKACVSYVGSLVCQFFGIEAATDYQSVKNADTGLYARFFREMLEMGVYLAPSQFEAMFISYSHTEDDINDTLNRAEHALKQLRG